MVQKEMPSFKVTVVETEKDARDFIDLNYKNIFIVFADLNLPDTVEVGDIIDFIRKYRLRTIVLTSSESLILRDKITNKLNVIDYVIKDNLSNIQYVTQLAKWIDKNLNNSIEAIIVGDVRLNRKVSEAILIILGFKTYEATNGKEALNIILKNQQIGLVITELEVSGFNGVELTSILRKNVSRPLIIVGLTASRNQLEAIKFLKYGANDYIQRPFSKEEFINRVRKDMLVLEQTIELEERIKTISEQKAEIEKLANTDSLTQLYNRYKFNLLFEENIYKSTTHFSPFTIILFDIDRFKSINDNFGHDVGDYVLVELPKIVKTKLREEDIFARWGGEEFVILLPNSGIARGVGIAEKIRRAIEIYEFKFVKRITASFGVSKFNRGDTAEKLLKRADSLLYKAKQNGRNRIEY
jgi:diguanylate cyclase (GGDEF)-like protein